MNCSSLLQLVFLILLASAAEVRAQTQVFLIGGGYTLDASQGQIEQNVHWLADMLRPESDSLDIFYGNGDEAAVDVVYWAENTSRDYSTNPLAAVYQQPGSDFLRYKKHELQANRGSTQKDHLLNQLQTLLPKLQGPDLLLIYNGHGGYGGDHTPQLSTLKTWERSFTTVAELRSTLNLVPTSVTTRFVFTQCFSGGFYHLINQSRMVQNKTSHRRCGFMAGADNEEVEGCELGINKDDFRDYSTSFFAALLGTARFGGDLETVADLNNDGKVSYREAHLYTLKTAISSGLPRSTSEMYLEQWEPWFLRWSISKESPENEYSQAARYIAEKNHISLTTSLVDQCLVKEHNLQQAIAQKEAIARTIEGLQGKIRNSVEGEFPFLKHPYASQYISTITNQLQPVQKYIQSQPQFTELIQQLNAYEQAMLAELRAKRELTQVKKVERMFKLAQLQNGLLRFASQSARQEYSDVLSCEEGFLK